MTTPNTPAPTPVQTCPDCLRPTHHTAGIGYTMSHCFKGDMVGLAVCHSFTITRLRQELATLQASHDALKKKVENQRRELSWVNEQNRNRNLELDALHFVWCDGGCRGGVHRFDKEKLTAEHVAAAIRNTVRLERWFLNNRDGQPRPESMDRYRDQWASMRKRVQAAITAAEMAELASLAKGGG